MLHISACPVVQVPGHPLNEEISKCWPSSSNSLPKAIDMCLREAGQVAIESTMIIATEEECVPPNIEQVSFSLS